MGELDDAVLDMYNKLRIPIPAIYDALKILDVKEEKGFITLNYKNSLKATAKVHVKSVPELVERATGIAIMQEIEHLTIPPALINNTKHLFMLGKNAYDNYVQSHNYKSNY